MFFVISGYLMTRIIVGRMGEGRFRLADFYLARLKRIWPALVVMCGALCVVGALALDPWTYQRAVGDVPATLAFLSNFTFAGRLGYFSPGEASTFLLHTWSLSVEWQFYLVYPLVLMGVFAVPALRRRVWTIVGVCAALSFGSALAISTHVAEGWHGLPAPIWGLLAGAHSAERSFYILPTRAWALLAGALVVAAETRSRARAWLRAACHAAGLGLICIGAAIADPIAGWPSAAALLPVGGAALVIVAGLRRTLWAELPGVDLVGRASYSIYVWHWPVILLLRYADVRLTAPIAVAEVVGIVALGLASYWLIEQRLTAVVFQRSWRRWAPGLVAPAAIALATVAAAQTNGFEAWRVAGLPPTERALLADDRAARDDWVFPAACPHQIEAGQLRTCVIGDLAQRQVAVIGDSHAEQFAPRYMRLAQTGQPSLTYITREGCLPIPGVRVAHAGSECPAWVADAFAYVERGGFRRVVIEANWAGYFDVSVRGAAPDANCAPDSHRCLARSLGSRPDARRGVRLSCRRGAATAGARHRGGAGRHEPAQRPGRSRRPLSARVLDRPRRSDIRPARRYLRRRAARAKRAAARGRSHRRAAGRSAREPLPVRRLPARR